MPLPFDSQPPPIAPVPEGIPRPSWSVMIPTFNCAKYLRQTLDSVLAQDPGVGQMQIEVIDDCSTADDPVAVVREVGKGRVAFFRKPKNEGAIANFNSCIQRSQGQLVHILHGDDYVLPGFYDRLAVAAKNHPDLALFASRSFLVGEEGVVTGVSNRLPELEIPARTVDSFFYSTPIQTPGVVMRRSFYESHGGFLPALVHTADCEMWSRAVGTGGGIVTSDVLACYRIFAANDTRKLERTGENLRDIARLNQLFAERYPHFNPQKGNRWVCVRAWGQAQQFAQRGDREAEQANLDYWKRHTPAARRFRIFAGKLARRVLG